MKTQILIVGQGLCGSILANAMLMRGIDFVVVDSPDLSASSKIAAGIWNPVVFKRMTSSWMAKEVIPYMYDFFGNLEILYRSKYLYPKKILKFFTEKQEAELWKKKYKDELSDFIDSEIFFTEQFKLNGINRPEYGFSFVNESGHLNCKDFLNKTYSNLLANGRIISEKFDASKLTKENDLFRYENITCEKVIFCEGWLGTNNILFNWVPFKPAKGELIIFESQGLNSDFILNKGLFVLPLENKIFIAGATYEWNNLNDTVSIAKQVQLEQKLRLLINTEFKILDRKAGVRPSIIDRRPVVGEHPDSKGIFIFNGFGTKSVMLAPYFSDLLLKNILNGSVLPIEVGLNRFKR